jgi:hypothetical protein
MWRRLSSRKVRPGKAKSEVRSQRRFYRLRSEAYFSIEG